jgi:hypothetical protein
MLHGCLSISRTIVKNVPAASQSSLKAGSLYTGIIPMNIKDWLGVGALHLFLSFY